MCTETGRIKASDPLSVARSTSHTPTLHIQTFKQASCPRHPASAVFYCTRLETLLCQGPKLSVSNTQRRIGESTGGVRLVDVALLVGALASL